MHISIFGLGYVGSVSAVGLAELGHQVIGVDIVTSKVDGLSKGQAPIREPQLNDFLHKNLSAGRLEFTTDTSTAVVQSDCAMITVGTPSDEQGNVNLSIVERCVRSIALELGKGNKDEYLIVIRSTVPPGTTKRIAAIVEEVLRENNSACKVYFSMNPEFTREGAAVEDFFHPAVTVFGTDEERIKPKLNEIYKGIEAETIWTTTRTAELVKYTNNAFHALKVAFANEIGRVATAYDIDSKLVMKILCTDKKLNISSKYLRPGFAFGGSCLPKDLRGIHSIAHGQDVAIPLLDSILPSNDRHIDHFLAMIASKNTKKIGVLGIAFKAKTDDLRESAGLRLVCQLIAEGFSVKMTDINLSPTYLMGRNKQYIDDMLPNWEQYFSQDAKVVFDHAETIVVTTPEAIHERWIAQFQTDQEIIRLS